MFRFRSIRDRLLGDPAIRDRIGRLPIGRHVSAHHAQRLFGTVAGFAESQLLAAGVELGIFEQLHQRPCAEQDWQALCTLPESGAAALLQGLIASGLLERQDGEILLSIDGLVVATDLGLRAMIRHNRLLYEDMADPVAMLRGGGTGRIAGFWPYDGGSGDSQGYSALMAESQSFVADAAMAGFDFSTAGHVLDLGGGDGRFVAQLARRYPNLKLSLADLPPVLAVARESLTHQGLADRVTLVPADEPLPQADVVTLVRVLHDHDDASASAMIARAASALAPGGRVVVAEPMALSGRDPQTAYFAAYFAAMRSGRLRTPSAIRNLLREASLKPSRKAKRPSALLSVQVARQ